MADAPNLSERDARLLTEKIVDHIQKIGQMPVERFGVYLQPEGFYFVAMVGGFEVHARTGQGQFTYADVAAAMVNEVFTQRAERAKAQKES